MAGKHVVEHNCHADFFRSRIKRNIHYWQDFVYTIDKADILEREFLRIVRAISFGLGYPEIWTDTYNLLFECSSFAEKRGFLEQWVTILNRADDVASQVEDVQAQIHIVALLARFTQLQSHFPQSIKHYRRALTLSRQNDDLYNEARACTNLGFLYIERGYWYRAEVLCRHALQIFRQLNSNHGQAHTENHLGLLYTRQKQWDKAQQHLKHACTIWQQMPNEPSLTLGLANLGVLYNEMEQPNIAIKYLSNALQKAKLLGDKSQTGTIHVNLSISYRLKKLPAEAEAHAQCAETIFQNLSNLTGLAHARDNLGLACMDQNHWGNAKYYFDSALELWQSLNNQHAVIRTMILMVEYELAQNNQSQARKRIVELEQLNCQKGWSKQYPKLMESLAKHRGSLV